MLLERAEIVLCLRGKPCVPEEDYEEEGDYKCVRGAVFFHIGYINYTSWRMVWHELRVLEESGRPVEDDKMLLQAYSMTQHLDSIPGLQDDGIRVDCAAVMECLDLNLEYTATFLAIDSGGDMVPNHRMKCGFVQVSKLPSIEAFRLWLGLKQEQENRGEHGDSQGSGKRKQQGASASGSGDRTKQAKLENYFDSRRRVGRSAAAQSQEDPAFDADVDQDQVNREAVEAALAQLMAEGDDAAGTHGSGGVENQPDNPDYVFGQNAQDAQAAAELFFSELETKEDQPGSTSDTDSDSSSSTSSSSSGTSVTSGPAADAVEAEAAEGGVGDADEDVPYGPRRAAVAEFVLEVADIGHLRFNETGQFMRAQCPVHSECFRRRAVYEGRLGQGRPIGVLVAWLQEAKSHGTRAGHVASRVPNHARRRAAREYFQTLRDADKFLSLERKLTDEERRSGELEPARIP